MFKCFETYKGDDKHNQSNNNDDDNDTHNITVKMITRD